MMKIGRERLLAHGMAISIARARRKGGSMKNEIQAMAKSFAA